jgi:hypothetical protein
MTIQTGVLNRKPALPYVARQKVVVRLIIPPRKFDKFGSCSGRMFPLGFSRKSTSAPFGERSGIRPADVCNRMIPATFEA